MRLLDPVLRSQWAELAVRGWVSAVTRQPPEVALRRLVGHADAVLARVDLLAIELDGGVHAKHRLTAYHDFFVERVREGESVLDVGCGKGELAHDLATRARADVTGIDVNAMSLAFARERFGAELELVEADARDWEPPRRYDVVVLSNVLEHIEDRVGLLQRLVEAARPDRVLLRVPLLERDWLVALRRELGLPYYSDPTHETEYSPAQLTAELGEAGLELVELQQRWGELWAVARRE